MCLTDKAFLALIIIGFTGMSFFFGHETGFINGQDYQKSVNGKVLENCNRLLVGQIYE